MPHELLVRSAGWKRLGVRSISPGLHERQFGLLIELPFAANFVFADNRIQQMQVVHGFKRRSIFSLEPMVESFIPRMVFALISMSLSILDNRRRTYRHFIEGQLEDNHDGRKTVL